MKKWNKYVSLNKCFYCPMSKYGIFYKKPRPNKKSRCKIENKKIDHAKSIPDWCPLEDEEVRE